MLLRGVFCLLWHDVDVFKQAGAVDAIDILLGRSEAVDSTGLCGQVAADYGRLGGALGLGAVGFRVQESQVQRAHSGLANGQVHHPALKVEVDYLVAAQQQ
jgi:hypothetical protein